MLINNQNQKINFSGIYRLPKNSKNIADLEQHVAPMFQYLKQEPIIAFEGKNPFKIGVDFIMNLIANSQNSSTTWLRMNATNHGANLNSLADDTIHIVSGKKDIEQLIDYMKNRLNKKTNFLERVKKFFTPNNENTYLDKPEHLRILFKALEVNNEENIAFEKSFKNKIIETKTPQDLLAKMLCEK